MKKKGQQKKQIKPKIDYLDLINRNVHDFKMVYDYSGFQYTRLDLSAKSLDVLSQIFKQFKYLQIINLSNNSIVDFTHLAALPVLTTLIADHNNVKDFKAFNIEDGWKSLRVLNLSFNKIADLGSLAAVPLLNELYLTQNKIEKVQSFGGHSKLKKLQLRRNKVGNLQGLGNLQQLVELYLAQNKIKSLTGLDIPKIKRLHLRKNLISVFDQTFPAWQQLQYLNVRQNSIEKIQEIQKTKDLPNLHELIFSKNPVITKSQYYLFEIINTNLRLTRINKMPITKSIKLQAFKHAQDKWKAAKQAEQQKRREQQQKAQAQLQAAGKQEN